MKHFYMAGAAALTAAILAGCGAQPMDPLARTIEARTTLQPTQGQQAQGELRWVTQKDGSVRVTGEVRGLKPSSTHGFHVHEKGDCSAPDASSAGGHFNPTNTAHAHHGAGHAGDLPSLHADAQGVAKVDFSSRNISLRETPINILGLAAIVHANPDDGVTQPTGNAGGRIACGTIDRYYPERNQP